MRRRSAATEDNGQPHDEWGRQGIRRLNLARAVHSQLLSMHDIAGRLGGAPQYWAALVAGREPFPANLSRQIEAALALPNEWLDTVPGSPFAAYERPTMEAGEAPKSSPKVVQFRPIKKSDDSGNFNTLLARRTLGKEP